MLHIRRYLKILGEARKIIDSYGSFPDVDDAGYRGALCIYETAFEQLVISGMPLSEEKDVLRIDTDGDTFVLRKERDAGRLGRAGYPLQGNRPVKEEGIPWEEAPVLNTKENGADSWEGAAEHTRNNDPDRSETEKPAAKEEYRFNANPDAGQEEDPTYGTGSASGEDENLPDDYGIDVTVAKVPGHQDKSNMSDDGPDGEKDPGAEDGAEQKKAMAAPEAGVDEKPAGDDTARQDESPEPAGFNTELLEGVETEYEKKETVELPDHMFRDDFTFSYTDISIAGANGKKAVAQAIIAPLSINEEYPRIICCTIQGGKSETILSKDNRLKIRVGGFTVKVEGRMEDGKFKSSCTLPAHYLLEGTRIETSTRDFGTKGHILLEEKEEDLQIHIIPATFRNNASGDAEYIYFISRGGEETAGDTSVMKAASFTFGGKEYEVRCRWNADGILYSMAAEKGECIGTDGDA